MSAMITQSKPEQSTAGWPASCLSLGAHYYDQTMPSGDYAVPVSGDAQAHMDVDRYMNYIKGRMLKIQFTADDHRAEVR
jgi:hypothetical protein